MKKIFACILLFSLLSLLLSSCGYKQNKWLSEEKLSKCLIPDFPEIQDNYLIKGNNDIYVNFSEEEYKSYVNEVYEYLKSKNFEYLGTRGEINSSLSGAFTSYYFQPAETLEDFFVDGAYRFVYSDGKIEGLDDTFRFRILIIDNVGFTSTKTVEDNGVNFKYNTVIKVRYNSEYPLNGIYVLPEPEEEHEHSYGEWQYDDIYHWRNAYCNLEACDIDTVSEHYDWDTDAVCDVCGYNISASSELAEALIDYENSQKERIAELRKEKPEYNFYYHQVSRVSCTLILDRDVSADAIIEKHGMNGIFKNAEVTPLNAIKMISIVFDRDDFTEHMHASLTEISDKEPLITNLLVDYETEWAESYMPKIEYYTDTAAELEYEETVCPITTDCENSFIFTTKAEYDAYLDALIEKAENDFRKENIAAQKTLYDEAFFAENDLVITKVIVRGSVSINLTVDNLYISGDKIYVVVRTDVPSLGDAAMQYATFAFILRKGDVSDVNEVITLE